MNQLTNFIAAGGQIQIKGRTYTVEGSSQDGDTCVATFRGARASYPGVLCINTRVAAKPGAEVWSIIGTRAPIADFAIYEGKLYVLR